MEDIYTDDNEDTVKQAINYSTQDSCEICEHVGLEDDILICTRFSIIVDSIGICDYFEVAEVRERY